MSSKIIADNITGGNATDYVQNDANGIRLVGAANKITTSNGTNALTFLNNGDVGIGTTAPTANLQVAQVTAGTGTVTTSGTTALVGSKTQFTNTFKVGDTITVSGETDRTIASITDDTHLTVSTAFSTSASGLTYTLVGGTVFSVLGNGNVGIGTTTPTDTLQVNGSSLATTAKGGTVTDYVQNDANGVHLFGVANKLYISSFPAAPSSATDTGTTGEVRITADYIYVCTATNTWVRASLTTW